MCEKLLAEKQTVQIMTRLLRLEQSDLGLHYLLR